MILLIVVITILFYILLMIKKKEGFYAVIQSVQDIEETIDLKTSMTRNNITFYWFLNKQPEVKETKDYFKLIINSNNLDTPFIIKYDPTTCFYNKILYYPNESYPLKVSIHYINNSEKIIGRSNELIIKPSSKNDTFSINKMEHKIQCYPNGNTFVTKDCQGIEIPKLDLNSNTFTKLKKLSNTINKNKIILT